MKYRQLGNTDLNLSILGMGCWAFGGGEYWGAQSQTSVNELVERALDLGINYFDTAEMYNNGKSEESLGIALANSGRRNDAIIGTKISPSNCYPSKIEERLNRSLKLLQTDYIDIYMLHWPIESHSLEHFTQDPTKINAPPSIETAFTELAELKETGKIKHIGLSNHGIEQMNLIEELGIKIAVNELPYNLFSRAIEPHIIPYCQNHEIGIFGYMALQQGILAGVFSSADQIPAPQAHSRHFKQERGKVIHKSKGEDGDNGTNVENLSRHFEPGVEDEMFAALDQMRILADQEGVSIAQLSLAWALSNPSITSTLAGSRDVTQLQENVSVVDYNLPTKIYNQLNQITEDILQKLGDNPDYYENRQHSRIH